MGKQIARWYLLYSVFLFGIQSFVALLGATSLVYPDLPSPVSFEYGRAIHLFLATFWPAMGMMGIVQTITIEQLKEDIYSPQIAQWQFIILVFSSLGQLGTLTLEIGNGREYFDGLPIFYGGIAFGILLGTYNLLRTIWLHRKKATPVLGVMSIGMVFLCLLLIPNLIPYNNPVADEAIKFWVVHLWEEMAFELMASGFILAFFIVNGIVKQRDMENWLYLESSLSVIGGLFGTGHHYFWIGFPAIWLLLGTFFSVVQSIPVFLLAVMIYKGLKKKWLTKNREKLVLYMIISSLFHHLTGATLLGLFITIPWVNLYTHGTYLTSGHAHLALFGTMGFLVLAGAYYILSENQSIQKSTYKLGILGILFLNGGLMAMSTLLIIAGLIQSYFWRGLSMDFMEVSSMLAPYLLFRVLGGGLFTIGSVIIVYQIFKLWWTARRANQQSG